MKAVRFHEYGDPDVLRYEDVEQPVPGAGRSGSASPRRRSTRVDGNIRGGFMQGPIPVTLPHTPGIDVAGTVDALGEGVDGIEVGDRGHRLPADDGDGAAAEYVVAPAEILAPAPTSIPLADAAALPVVGLTAWQALFDHAELTAGQRVLINGAGGAVGGYAVQLAKRAGAYVIATAGPRSSERVRTAGADEVIDHTTTEVTAAVTEPVDVVLNLAPIDPAELAALVALVRPGGVVVNTTVWMPAPGDEERGVRGIDLFVRSDAEQLSRLVGAGRPRRAARRRRRAGAAGRAAGDPRPGRRGRAARQGHRPPCRGAMRFPGADLRGRCALPPQAGRACSPRPAGSRRGAQASRRTPASGRGETPGPHPSRPAPRPREVQRVHDAEGGGRRSTTSTQPDGTAAAPRPSWPPCRPAGAPA